MGEDKPKKLRGFAAMSPEKRLELARRGGAAVPKHLRSFSVNRKLASQSGHKGGTNVPDDKRSFSRDRQLAINCGSKGGTEAQKRRRLARPPMCECGFFDCSYAKKRGWCEAD